MEGEETLRAGETQDVTIIDTEIVTALRKAVADRVGQQRFAFWFGEGEWLSLRQDAVVLGVPNAFYQDWLRVNFRQEIEASCLAALGRNLPVEFEIQSLMGEVASNRLEPVAPTAAGPMPDAANVLGSSASSSSASSSPPQDAGDAEPRPSLRTPSPRTMSRRRFATLEAFVEGEATRLALSTARLAVQEPGKWSPLYLHGPAGVGKTHLLEGIWSATRDSRRSARVLYLTAEQFTTYFLQALHGSGMPNFRNKYRSLDLLLVDDVQHFRGKPRTVEELFRTTDALIRAHKQVVFAADVPPGDLAELGQELASRLQAGMTCRVAPPDALVRREIVRRLNAAAGLGLPDAVQEYIASRLTGSVRELSGAVNRLHAVSLALGQPITLALAEEALAEMVRHNAPVVDLGQIERAVCQAFGLPSDSLQADGKAKSVSHPRMLAMWLARKHTRAPLSEIGQYFGRRSHSTVVSAQQKINTLLAEQGPLHLAHRPWSIEEAIRRVEEKLRAV